MSAIQNLQEAWNGHTNQEVEDFIKKGYVNVVRFISYNIGERGGKLTLVDIDAEDLLSMLLSGPVYGIVQYESGEDARNFITGLCCFDGYNSKVYINYEPYNNYYYYYQFPGGCCGGGCCC